MLRNALSNATLKTPLSITLPQFHALLPSTCLFAYQNLSFGMNATMKKANIINPNIHAYNIMRPHHPFPSLICRRYPIRRLAASRPSAFLSSPSPALSTSSFSPSSDNWKFWEDSFRAFAIASMEAVSSSCSLEWCDSSVSVIGFEIEEALVYAVSCADPVVVAAFRARRDDPNS